MTWNRTGLKVAALAYVGITGHAEIVITGLNPVADTGRQPCTKVCAFVGKLPSELIVEVVMVSGQRLFGRHPGKERLIPERANLESNPFCPGRRVNAMGCLARVWCSTGGRAAQVRAPGEFD